MAYPHRWAARIGAVAAVFTLSIPFIPPTSALADDGFTFTDSRITEASGMATDTVRSFYWTINNTEQSGVRIYAVKPDGQTVASIRFAADVVDPEALSYENGTFYVGDIGDDRLARETISVYVLSRVRAGTTNADYTRYRLEYPDGPRDAEGMWVHDGRLYIVSKEASGAGIYVAPESLDSRATNTLQRIGDAPAGITDAVRLTDGRVVVRTYTSVFVLDPSSFNVLATKSIPGRQQGETVTQSMDGASLLLGADGQHSKVIGMDIPTSIEQPTGQPSPGPTTPSEQGPTESPSSSEQPSPSAEGEQPSAGGLFDTRSVPVLIAAGVALVAGLVVFLRRR